MPERFYRASSDFDFLKVKIPLPSPEVRENIAKMAYNLICESKGAIADLNSINSVVISDIEQLILQ